MQRLAEIIVGFFGTATDLSAFAAGIALVGGLGMSVVQALKDVTPLRRRYNRRAVHAWLREHLNNLSEHPKRAEALREALDHAKSITAQLEVPRGSERFEPVSLDDLTSDKRLALLESDLLLLSVDGDREALYELEIGDMTARLKAALQAALDAPHRYRTLVALAGGWSAPIDLAQVLAGPPPLGMGPEALTRRSEYANARGRVLQQFQGATDALTARLSFRWKRQLQLYAFGCCMLVMGAVFLAGCDHTRCGHAAAGTTWAFIPIMLVSSVLAGFFAPVARDLVAVLAKVRNL